MKITIVYGNDGSDVRIAKTCRTLVGFGHEVHFVGWDRRVDVEKDSTLPDVSTWILKYPVPKLRWTLGAQVAFSRHAIRSLWRIRPDIVCAVNEDNVLRIGWLKGIAYRKLVCDVFDSHLDRTTGKSWPIRSAVWGLANAARYWSDRLIATDDVRYDTFGRFRTKTTVIGNFPPDPGPQLSRRPLTGPPKIFVSGTLSRIRGLDTLIDAADRCPGLKIVTAGWAADEFSSEVFLKHPAVEFLGHVTPAQSLEIAADCDAVLAMYAPTCRNNILASPNKIYDALSVGRPVVINSEALVSQWVQSNRVGFVCPYADAAALGAFLNSALNRRGDIAAFAKHARSLFESGYSWEAMEKRLGELYGGLGDQPDSTIAQPRQVGHSSPEELSRAA